MVSSSENVEEAPAAENGGKLRNVKHASGDGFWAWVVVAGAVIYSSIRASTDRCYSVFYFPLMRDYNIDFAQVSQLFGAFNIGYACSGLLVPVITKYWTDRKWMMLLGVVVSTTALVSSFRVPFWWIVILFGFIPGLCFGIQIVLAIHAVATHAQKHRTLALQLLYMGISVGPFVGCPTWQLLVSTYTWSGAILVISGFYLNLVVTGATMRPPTVTYLQARDENTNDENNKLGDHDYDKISVVAPEDNEDKELNIQKSNNYISRSQRDLHTQLQPENMRQTGCCGTKLVRLFASHYDLNLFRRVDTYLLITTFMFYIAGSSISTSLLVPFGIQELGTSETEASFLPSAMAAGEIVAKLVNGLFFTKIPHSKRKLVLAAEYAIIAVALCILPSVHHYVVAITLCTAIGLLYGASDGHITCFMVEVGGPKLVPSLASYMNMCAYIFVAVVTLGSGELVKWTGNTASGFYVGGVCFAMSAASYVVFNKFTNTTNVEG